MQSCSSGCRDQTLPSSGPVECHWALAPLGSAESVSYNIWIVSGSVMYVPYRELAHALLVLRLWNVFLVVGFRNPTVRLVMLSEKSLLEERGLSFRER